MSFVDSNIYRDRTELKKMIDKPNLTGFQAFNKIFKELGLYMEPEEVDKIIDWLYQVEDSKYDINPSIADSEAQLRLILGSDRYDELVSIWTENNQFRLKQIGTKKYRHKKTQQLYDGLDPEDNPLDYEIYYV